MNGGVEFARPESFALLSLALFVLWYARRAASRPVLDATGTIDVWKRTANATPLAAERPRIPPAVWWLLAAIVMAVVALAEPRARRAAGTRTLVVVVDRSPSMYLQDGARTRIEHALELAQQMIEAQGYEDVRWIAPPLLDDEAQARDAFPREWLEAPRFELESPDRASFDRDDVLFVTDRAPTAELARAGFCASGGAAVPGPIGSVGDRLVAWDGQGVVPFEPQRQLVAVLDRALPERVQTILTVWARARGLEVRSVPAESLAWRESDTALTLFLDRGPQSGADAVGRDGWTARAEYTTPLALRDEAGPLEPWLATRDGAALVAAAQGRIHLALGSIDEPRGDPAAWAVSWSRLFDAMRAPPPGCVGIHERSAAGATATRAPLRAASRARESVGPFIAISAGLAAACALVAAGLALSGKRSHAVAVP